MKLRLFHKIGVGGEDSAAVRQFLVDNALTDLIEFSNISYDKARSELFEASGAEEAPVLLADGKPIRGKSEIISWLKTNVLCWNS
jgi:hypothetical protein